MLRCPQGKVLSLPPEEKQSRVLFCPLPVGFEAKHLMLPDLSSFICEVGLIVLSASLVCCGEQMRSLAGLSQATKTTSVGFITYVAEGGIYDFSH